MVTIPARGLIAFAGFVCAFAHAQQLAPRPAPQGLSPERAQAWETLSQRKSTRSIEMMRFDPGILTSNKITFSVGGKAYLLQGSATRADGFPQSSGGRSFIGGPSVTWVGRSTDKKSSANLVYSDDGLAGGLTLDGQMYTVVGRDISRDGLIFLIEIDHDVANLPFEGPTGALPHADKATPR